MRYAQIRSMDVSNGEGVGVSLFVQGCPLHCKNCFNSDTWDFNGGKEWTEESKNKFLKLIDRPYIKRVSFLGGEPLAEQNVDGILSLIQEIRSTFPDKTIWLYTGYNFTELINRPKYPLGENWEIKFLQQAIIELCDVIVDGRYIDEQKDITLRFRGSKNQRIIDVQKSLNSREVALWTS